MMTLIIIIFIVGYTLIALSETIKINKAAIALLLGVTLWILYIFSGASLIAGASPASFHEFILSTPGISRLSPAQQAIKYVSGLKIIDLLGNTSEILFYLLGAMTIVEMIDQHGGFIGITNLIKTRNKKKLLGIVALLTFFMSSVLDNMTSAIVMMTLLQKLLTDRKERWFFGSIVIIAANAGGAWTPIGDITTIMLWINDNITSGNIIKSLLLPSLISLILPTILVAAQLNKQPLSTSTPQASASLSGNWFNTRERNTILIVGLLCLLFVPVFKSLTNLPPFMGILFTLGMAWIYIEVLYNRKPAIPAEKQYRIPYILSKIDFSTILFFLGILMAVGALEAIGVLDHITGFLNTKIHNIYIINIIVGFLSSIIDNVPLVAAVMGMYPVVSPETLSSLPDASYMANFVQNGKFWELAAYCAGTGGSLLIIGSAAGVVVMGLEKISFIWYLKHITWITLVGFLAGIGVYYLFNL